MRRYRRAAPHPCPTPSPGGAAGGVASLHTTPPPRARGAAPQLGRRGNLPLVARDDHLAVLLKRQSLLPAVGPHQEIPVEARLRLQPAGGVVMPGRPAPA